MRRRSPVLTGIAAMLFLAGTASAALAELAAGKAGTGTTTIAVTAGKPTEYRFTLSKATVPVGTVIFKVVNKGKVAHNFTIAGKKTPLLEPGKSATLTVVFPKAGSFAYRSSVAGQLAKGMKGVFAVTKTATLPASSSTPATVAAAPTCASPAATAVTVSLFEYGITLSQTSVPCGTVTFTVNNTGTIGHSFDVVGSGATSTLAAGTSTTLIVNLAKTGSYTYRCDVGNHAAMGMNGTLTVT